MKRISCNTDNQGGISFIKAIPKAVFNRVKTDYTTGKKYASVTSLDDVIELPVVNNKSYSFEETQTLEDGGNTYAVAIQGLIPRNETEAKLRSELERGEWLVLHTDRNGISLLSGTKEVPLFFASHRLSGAAPSATNGNAFVFSGQMPAPSVEVEEIIVE